MEWFEWFAIIGGGFTMLGAVWLEIRHRNGMDERVAVLESQVSGLPETVGAHGERLAALEGVRSSAYREPAPHDDEPPTHCRKCGSFLPKK